MHEPSLQSALRDLKEIVGEHAEITATVPTYAREGDLLAVTTVEVRAPLIPHTPEAWTPTDREVRGHMLAVAEEMIGNVLVSGWALAEAPRIELGGEAVKTYGSDEAVKIIHDGEVRLELRWRGERAER